MPPFDPIKPKKKESATELQDFIERQKLNTDMIIDVIHNTVRKEIQNVNKNSNK